MNDVQEIKIAIDDSFTGSVCDFSVGFLKFRVVGKEEFVEPMGTGIFVQLGKLRGILTAGHVLAKLDPQETIGLVRFPSVNPPLQNRRLNLQHTKRVVDWNGSECDAPDLGFVSMPAIDSGDLEAAGAVFYNLLLRRTFEPSPGNRMSECGAVVGIVAEWTEEGASKIARGKKITVGGLFGTTKSIRRFKEGASDLSEVEINYETGPRIPKSYGGVSGGALWELHVELDRESKVVKVSKKLNGVAFRQSADRKRVTVNAAPLIEAFVQNKIVPEWPEATAR